MQVTIYGASDDLVEIEGDIEDEINAYGRSPKLYIYTKKGLQFVIKTSFKEGFWEVYPLLDGKEFDSDNDLLEASNWNINMRIQGIERHNRNSMVLEINSGDTDFEIVKRRRK